ncbi:hypothetical protein IFR04_010506 [Cadophora malorum]|uniref:Ankyrin n=1 Tax=Cadophora malorum TaxID=108018 RepID=A0A8H7T782_9HELO|nr:hypothetical protein IFR04_010506 [Cadophora malorum]
MNKRGSNSTMKLALARCTTLMNELAGLVPPDQEASSSFRRKRASFKFVRKGDKIQQLKSKISEAKNTLLLALFNLESRTTQSYNESFRQSFSIQTRQLDTIRELLILPNLSSGQQQQMLLGDPTPASLSTDQTMVTISGSIQDEVVDVTGATVLDLSLMQPSKSAIRCKSRTANYEKAKRYQSAFQRTYITVTQTPFGKLVRPEDSSIFAACRTGDIEEVQRMLTDGEASINDTNEYGWTLLHV